MAEVGIERRLDRGAPARDGGAELLQVRPARGERGRAVAQEGGALAGENVVEARGGREDGEGVHGACPMLTVETLWALT